MAKVELLSSATHLFVLDTNTGEISIRHNATRSVINIPSADFIRAFGTLTQLIHRRMLEAYGGEPYPVIEPPTKEDDAEIQNTKPSST